MAKFEKFDPQKQIQGLAEAARQIQIEELIRDGKMPSFDRLAEAIEIHPTYSATPQVREDFRRAWWAQVIVREEENGS
jgi:hypothetical protein